MWCGVVVSIRTGRHTAIKKASSSSSSSHLLPFYHRLITTVVVVTPPRIKKAIDSLSCLPILTCHIIPPLPSANDWPTSSPVQYDQPCPPFLTGRILTNCFFFFIPKSLQKIPRDKCKLPAPLFLIPPSHRSFSFPLIMFAHCVCPVMG